MGRRSGLLVGIWLGLSFPARPQAPPNIKYIPPQNISPTKGEEMFRSYCSVCHGLDGRGGGPAADALKKRPADLTQLSRKNDGKFPVYKVANVIHGDGSRGAHGSRDMPMWGTVFRTLGGGDIVKLRIDNLTNYIQSLQRQ